MTPITLRPELERHLRQRLDAFGEGFRQNLALIGPPGSGKTFQLQQLLSRPPERAILIYCPLYRESCQSFLTRLLGTVLQAGWASCPATAEALPSIEQLMTRRMYGEAFNRILDAIPTLAGQLQRPCVLILDEFLCLEEIGLAHAFHELGKRVMTWPSTLFILASSSPHRARAILRERLQLLFGQFELLTLGALNGATATAWIHQELRGLRGGKAVAPFLAQWLGAYPWYLSIFVKRLRERAAMARGQQPSSESLFLQAAWDLLGDPEGTLSLWCLSRMERLGALRHGARAMEAFLHIGQGARTTTEVGRRIGRAGLAEALQLLIEHDLAQRNGTCWLIPDPILRCWLSTVFAAQRADARPDADVTRRQFDAHLQALWADWVAAHHLPFTQRIVGLLGQFTDETVSIDSKTGRLPKFQAITAHHPHGSPSCAHVVADGQGRRWCARVQEGAVDENAVADFEAFCRSQTPRPARKVVITNSGLEQNAKLLAKAANMWVWEAEELGVLMGLYGRR